VAFKLQEQFAPHSDRKGVCHHRLFARAICCLPVLPIRGSSPAGRAAGQAQRPRDFGGGTCDVCIIETTKEGDISQTGRNSKPLAAASKPIGGFFINRITAEDLFRAILGQPSSTRLKKGLAAYMEWRRAPKELTTYADELRNFIRSFHTATHRVENPKLTYAEA